MAEHKSANGDLTKERDANAKQVEVLQLELEVLEGNIIRQRDSSTALDEHEGREVFDESRDKTVEEDRNFQVNDIGIEQEDNESNHADLPAKKTRGVRHSQRLTKCTNGDIETEEINEDQTNFVDSCNDGSWSDDGDNCIKEANDSIHSIDGDQQDGYDNASDSENFDENTTSQGMKPLPQQRIEC